MSHHYRSSLSDGACLRNRSAAITGNIHNTTWIPMLLKKFDHIMSWVSGVNLRWLSWVDHRIQRTCTATAIIPDSTADSANASCLLLCEVRK
eukprot:5445070-Amphidinium_carterae.2